jgi:hypothetical protein
MTSLLLKVEHDQGQFIGSDFPAPILLAYLVILAERALQMAMSEENGA